MDARGFKILAPWFQLLCQEIKLATFGLNSDVLGTSGCRATWYQEKAAPQADYMKNLKRYSSVKTVAQSFLDVALLMANASQLKSVMDSGTEFKYFKPLLGMLALSISLQILVGLFLICIVISDLKNEKQRQNGSRSDILNTMATSITFLIVVVNIFITAFGTHN
ncbi:ninjurin-1-like isoform X1 [Lampetra planeri]